MSVTLEGTQTVPLGLDDDGVIRVTGSRVSLDTIIDEFKHGATAEQIQEDFPSLSLREIYGVIAYYLDHRDAVEDYLRDQTQAGEQTRERLESRPGLAELQARVRARRTHAAK